MESMNLRVGLLISALGHFCAGRYDDAAAWEERSLRDQPTFAAAIRTAAASNALAGRAAEAGKAMVRLQQLFPSLGSPILETRCRHFSGRTIVPDIPKVFARGPTRVIPS
jgi:hypothetical protein